LAGGGLGGHFWKSDANEKTLTWILGKLVALLGGISFPTFPNMAWQGIVLGIIFEKFGQGKKHYHPSFFQNSC
jgi:hypothetical protein